MTKPTPEQIQRACDLANTKAGAVVWTIANYGDYGYITALSDIIAESDAKDALIEAEKARADKAVADLREIDRIANKPISSFVIDDMQVYLQRLSDIAAVTVPYRVETDPLDAEAIEIVLSDATARTGNQIKAIREGKAGQDKIAVAKAGLLRGIELAKRGKVI